MELSSLKIHGSDLRVLFFSRGFDFSIFKRLLKKYLFFWGATWDGLSIVHHM
jgi:hypothetical protein